MTITTTANKAKTKTLASELLDDLYWTRETLSLRTTCIAGSYHFSRPRSILQFDSRPYHQVERVNAVGDAFLRGQARKRPSHFLIAGFSRLRRYGNKLPLDADPPAPMSFQWIVVGFVGFNDGNLTWIE